jgi:fatty acid-binding protein DegV
MIGKAMNKYRVVCQGEDGEIVLRAKAQDQYAAFERIVMFLRERQFDYRVVLVESVGTTPPDAVRRARAPR